MYIDLIVVLVLIGVVIYLFRRFDSFVYLIAIIDIALRILTFLKYNLGLPDVSALINKYIPESIPSLISKYASGTFETILIWIYLLIMVIFEIYIIKYFIKKRK